jgi:putative spermidine/putrescine transport system permease protein
VLSPSLLGGFLLLFANAFSAYATPYALSSGYINIVPVLIGEAVNGDLAANPQLGASLAFGMILFMDRLDGRLPPCSGGGPSDGPGSGR